MFNIFMLLIGLMFLFLLIFIVKKKNNVIERKMYRGRRIVMSVFTVILCVLSFVLIIIGAGRIINAQKYKIDQNIGIEKTEYINIGSIEQYVQVRGKKASNPIIIMLHGGPGNNMAYYSYYWQADLENDYTIVHWDQRGCGNTYYQNPGAAKPTVDLLLADLDELVDYIRVEYNQEKVIIMGHSWGTFIGGIYSGKHPEKISAYVGISQMLDFKKSEQVSSNEAIRLAQATGNEEDVEQLEQMFDTVMTLQRFDKSSITKFLEFRELKDKYLPEGNTESAFNMITTRLFSPYMTFNDFKWMINVDALLESNSEVYAALLSESDLSMYDYSLAFEVPVILIVGELDWVTPSSMTSDYFNNIESPNKQIIEIENAGHLPFLENSTVFSTKLVEALNKNGNN